MSPEDEARVRELIAEMLAERHMPIGASLLEAIRAHERAMRDWRAGYGQPSAGGESGSG